MEVVGISVALFVASNLDDVFLLIAFFADPALKTRHIVAGQYIGIAILYAVSLVASLVSLVIPEVYIGLLGLVPIGIGAFKLWELWRGESGADEQVRSVGGNVAAVAAITLASGGDNIAVYTPVFAVRPLGETLVIGCIFAVMVTLWVGAAHWLVRHPSLGAPIRRYGYQAVPFVFIAIGVWVLFETRTYTLLGQSRTGNSETASGIPAKGFEFIDHPANRRPDLHGKRPNWLAAGLKFQPVGLTYRQTQVARIRGWTHQ